jgi:isopentenyl phosphate kinase
MLQFLKLGGSLITVKDKPYTLRQGILQQAASEVHAYLSSHPGNSLIIGHGSGSFGHTSAATYGTKNGVSSQEEWLGYAHVCRDARALNQHVLNALVDAGVPAVSYPPSSAVRCSNGDMVEWDTSSIKQAIQNGLVPLIFGDTVLDDRLGGTICSTEDLFLWLGRRFSPKRVLIAGIEPGVWEDFPARRTMMKEIHASKFKEGSDFITGSHFTDVTGGMAAKVQRMSSMVQENPGCKVLLFTGIPKGAIQNALASDIPGTTILP